MATPARARRGYRLRHLVLAGLVLLGIAGCGEGGQRAVDDPLPGSVQDQPPRRRPALAGGAIGTTVDLDDSLWTGGRRLREADTTDGQTAIELHGSATEFHTVQASFTVDDQPTGTAELSIEGVDAGGGETPLRIAVNGREIYTGPSSLPFGTVESDTWSTASWEFDAELLGPGENRITITNLAPSSFGEPPVVTLDYAQVTYEVQ